MARKCLPERGVSLKSIEIPTVLVNRAMKVCGPRGFSDFVRAALADKLARRSQEEIREQYERSVECVKALIGAGQGPVDGALREQLGVRDTLAWVLGKRGSKQPYQEIK